MFQSNHQKIDAMKSNIRTGAKTLREIPTEILQRLNRGEIESVNLMEWLAVDQSILIEHILPITYQKLCKEPIAASKSTSALSLTRIIGAVLAEEIEQKGDWALYETVKNHPSDSVRCWAAFVVGGNTRLTLEEKLTEIRPFADDPHFGVRELAWMAVREELTTHLEKALKILEKWSRDKSENIRRFATEATRPNGVWCKKIDRLKSHPELASSILENLKSDPSKYVQNSVANWLNDAAKTRPDFVTGLCERWKLESPTPSTQYIVKRALRSIKTE